MLVEFKFKDEKEVREMNFNTYNDFQIYLNYHIGNLSNWKIILY